MLHIHIVHCCGCTHTLCTRVNVFSHVMDGQSVFLYSLRAPPTGQCLYCHLGLLSLPAHSGFIIDRYIIYYFPQIAKVEKLKPLEVELRRLEDLSESIVNDFAYMKKREEEMRDTNGETKEFLLKLICISHV